MVVKNNKMVIGKVKSSNKIDISMKKAVPIRMMTVPIEVKMLEFSVLG